jgi:hypothetical protein
MSAPLGRKLPHSIDAEMAFLGGQLLHPDKPLGNGLKPTDFAKNEHGWLFAAIREAQAAGIRFDLLYAEQWIANDERFAGIGGAAYLRRLAECAAAPINCQEYARLISDLAAKSELISIAESLDAAAHAADVAETADVLRARVRKLLDAHEQEYPPNGDRHLVDLSVPPLTPAAWAAASIPPPRYCLGALIGFDTRVMLFANTGAGKTMFAMALAVAAYLGRSFLGWKATGGRMRVLFVDGEMPRTLMRDRIGAAFAWFGEDPADHADGIFFLSRDDFPGMPPLDTAEGQRWLGNVIAQLAPDLAVLDNLMALTCQSLKEDAGWQVMKPWLLGLRCGWLLIHHTGHDATRGYGDKAKEWHVDTVALLQAVAETEADVAFDLSFTKARRRTPANRADFEKRRIELRQGEWFTGAVETRRKAKLTAGQEIVYRALIMAIDREGETVPAGADVPTAGARGVPEMTWRRYYYAKRPIEQSDKSAGDARSKAFREAKDVIETAGLAASSVAGWWWLAP